MSYQRMQQFVEGLDQMGKIQVEYIWIGGSGEDIRCKARTINKKVKSVEELSEWNFDGSSTDQAQGKDSEVIIKPRAIFRDPFRRGDNILALCDTYTPDGTPIGGNTRNIAKDIFDQCLDEKPWFGLEQEYTLFNRKGRPLGWPDVGFPGPQGPYYCSVGSENSFGRAVAEAHYRACLHAGINISGINAEVMAGQWEYQIGPCEGIECGDQVWMSRYIMQRVVEYFDVVVSFDPKPIPGEWNGAGCHANFSTEKMRKEGGLEVIKKAIEKLSKNHDEHIKVYGKGNERRLTGGHETAPIDKFSSGVANRGASIRIGNQTAKDGYGYFEDRRPSSNCDPYLVSSKLVETCCLKK